MSGAVTMRGLCRSYGSVAALADLDLEFERGKVHAVVGENGAGKSTLFSLLAGLLAPSAGSVEIFGETISNASESHRAGVGLLTQHGSLLPELSVAENFALAIDGLGRIDESAIHRTVAQSLSGIAVDPEDRVCDLACGLRQQAELARLLWSKRRILMLDEPTSVLGEAEASALLKRMAQLAGEGVTVVFSSHRVDEVLGHADVIHVLRRGRLTASLPAEGISRNKLIEAMFPGDSSVKRAASGSKSEAGAVPALELRGLVCEGSEAKLELVVNPGEIVGVVGLAGNGQENLIATLAGLRPFTSGAMIIGGEKVSVGGWPRDFGLRCLPQDAVSMAGVESMSVLENLSLHFHQDKGWICDWARLREAGMHVLVREKIDGRYMDWPLALLSGGNRRKTLLARELDATGGMFVAHNPEAGLDAMAVAGLAQRLSKCRDSNQGVLVFAEELDFVEQIANRIFAMKSGELIELDREDWRAQARSLLTASPH